MFLLNSVLCFIHEIFIHKPFLRELVKYFEFPVRYSAPIVFIALHGVHYTFDKCEPKFNSLYNF